MGQEIVYCFKCQTRLLGADFEKGKAFKVGPRAACIECVKVLLSSEQIQQEVNRVKGAAPDRAAQEKSGKHLLPASDLPPTDSTSKVRSVPGRPPVAAQPSTAPFVAGAVAGIFGLLILLALAFSTGRPSRPNPAPGPSDTARSEPSPPPEPPPEPVRPPPRPAPPPPRPADPPNPAKDLPEIDRELSRFSERQEFRRALEYLMLVQSRHSAADWVRAVDERIGQTQQHARRAAAAAAEQAAAARRKGAEGEVAQLRAKVAEWRLPAALDDFDRIVSPSRLPAPVPEGALVVYADRLAPGWSDFSWGIKADLACESTVFEGARSISVAPEKPASGLHLGSAGRLDTSPYSHVSFRLFSRVPGIAVTLSLYGEKEGLAEPFALNKVEGGLPAGEWRNFVVPLARLGAVRAKIKGVVLQASHVSAEPVFFVDHVLFLKGTAEEPSGPPAGLEAYRARWTQAVAKAARRDYAAAERDLEEALAALKEGPVREEAAADLADLRAAKEALAEAIGAVLRTPRLQKFAVEFVNVAGAAERLEGMLVSADATRVAIKVDTTVFEVPAGELKAAWLGDLYRRRPAAKPADDRAAALLCLFEGDVDAAQKLAPGALPEKRSALARPESDAAPRALLWAAEAEFGSPRQRAAAVEKYLALVGEHGSSALVARNRPFLAARLEAARETVWAADDLTAAGNFLAWTLPKQDPVWLNHANAKGSAKENYVEFEFYALPETTYRAWIHAGGCCYETLTCFMQASELKGPSPKNPKETASFEPGAEEGMPVRVTSLSLPRLHSAHGGQRQPARWDWLPLTLPKFETPGRKKVRVLTEEIGFGVAGAFVSVSRSSPPRDGEWTEWMKLRPPLEPFPTGQVVWERFRAIPGVTVAELTGNPTFERKPSSTGAADKFALGDLGDHYGIRVRGYLVPPMTGPYTFWITSDDLSELWLSSDESPLKKAKIADLRVEAAPPGEWGKEPNQKSAPVTLTAGRRYYIEALQKENDGDAHVGVGWQLPDGTQERPIPGKRLSPYGVMPTRKLPRRLYRAINLNGPPLVIDGHSWEGRGAPHLSTSERAMELPTVKLDPPTDAARAQMIRASVWDRPSSSVKLTAVPPGTYEIFLYVWEDNEAQVVDFLVQGQVVQEKYNSGPAGHWDRLGPWKVTVGDGTLELSTRGGDANLSGLEVWRLGR